MQTRNHIVATLRRIATGLERGHIACLDTVDNQLSQIIASQFRAADRAAARIHECEQKNQRLRELLRRWRLGDYRGTPHIHLVIDTDKVLNITAQQEE